ncbi:hypothetical protein HCU64_03305 [Methylobacterium sp. C25]|uniref:hypothetical protein n=1 Tax=Methylobacterium sp. C25 TaxID=2721622 RepID=UPI001F1ECA78|nr:hypothetical protein [Methylobacterium sp. C25]MCE4222767.1 hypothetical protein [Methylobacterium sp. C25]
MALSSENLVGYLRAEFSKAARRRVWLFFVQLAIAVPAAISVVVSDAILTYILALIGVALLIFWWALNASYLAARNAAHSARRAALLSGGLVEQFSPSEIMSLKSRLTVSEVTAKSFEKTDYYASKLPIGASRLGELLEESAFYSADLQRASATCMLVIIVIFTAIATLAAVAAVPFFQRDTTLLIVRIGLAVLVFAMSSDLLGAYVAHKSAARAIEEVRARLITADRSGYPFPDVLLAMMDYSSAVESAPESVPFAYRFTEKDLNQRWAEYQNDREAARAAA